MSFEVSELFAFGLTYLLLLFGIAFVTDRGWIPDRVIRHPATYILSLGVFAGAWAFFGAVGLAHQYGYGYLAYYFGVASLFLFAPLLLMPLLRVCRLHQLNSLADLLTFRYRSQWAGVLVTLCLLLAVLPLLAMQIQAVSDSVRILSHGDPRFRDIDLARNTLALVFCITITLFSLLFGVRHTTGRERHKGLIAAIAFESLVKIGALNLIGLLVVFRVFGGFDGLENWLAEHPDLIRQLQSPLQDTGARTLLLIFCAATVVMPHMFHMVFAENPNTRALSTASWGAPLLFLGMSLPVLPILWAGLRLGSPLSPEFFTLGVGIELDSAGLGMLAFIGGLSASSGAMIVITLAMASMCLNHLILPLYRFRGKTDIYSTLLWIRRVLIIAILGIGYLFYTRINAQDNLASLGLAAFIATLQFAPGVLAVLYWPGANRKGFIAGLITGYAVWFFSLLLPFISEQSALPFLDFARQLFAREFAWNLATVGSIGANVAVMALVSLLTRASPEEQAAAAMCSLDQVNRPARLALGLHAPADFEHRLAPALGEQTAAHEVAQALADLRLDRAETRPYALRRLRDQLEANLSGLLGPATAHDLINERLPYEYSDNVRTEDIRYIEDRIEQNRDYLTGLAAELDRLRRYHRQTLQGLPVGLFTLGADGEVLMWNDAMAALTGVAADTITGSTLDSLPHPWARLFQDFLQNPDSHWQKRGVTLAGQNRWLALHKTEETAQRGNERIVVIEDVTETHRLEQELIHSERLASIGRLAAGVAHEIGNPVTGVACLAQNLRYDSTPAEIRHTADTILEQTRRISDIVQSLVRFAHSGHPAAQTTPEAPVRLRDCVDEAMALLALNKEAPPVRFDNRLPDALHATGNAQHLQQVFINLLGNARDASPDDGTVTVTGTTRDSRIQVRVEDDGPGIPPAAQERIFEPFYTTKEPGQGTGLGLYLAYTLLEEHQGRLRVESPCRNGRGTAMILDLPAAGPAENGAPAAD